MVHAGDHLLQIDDRPFVAQVEQLKAQKEHDEALLENAKTDLERYNTLWKQDSIPQQTLATQTSLVKQDQGTVDSDQALIDAAQLNIIYSDITAPIDGRVGLRLVDVGKLRAGDRDFRPRRHHADSADHGDLHDSGGQHFSRCRRDEGEPAVAGGCLHTRRLCAKTRQRNSSHHR